MAKFIFLDTETTGITQKNNNIIELGCIKVDDLENILNEEVFHVYCKPEFPIHRGAFNIHGLSEEFLQNKPKFAEIVDKFLQFIGDSILIAHNAQFDIKFLNEELYRIGKPPLNNKVIDSLAVARKLYPGSPVGIDALLKRFKMGSRNLHSAIDDARMLCRIYSQMLSQKEDDFFSTQKLDNNTVQQYKMCTDLI